MRRNLFSIKLPIIRKVFLAICFCSILLSACQGGTPRPTTTPAATVTPGKTSTSTAVEGNLPTDILEPLPTIEGENLSPTDSAIIVPGDSGGDPLPTDGEIPTDISGQNPSDSSNLDQTPAPDSSNQEIPTGALLDPLSGTQTPNDGTIGSTPEPTQSVEFKPTPAGVPLGEPGNPMMLGVVVSPNEADQGKFEASQQLALQLSQITGHTVEVQQVNSNTELLNGMQVGAIHMAWLQPFTYILASRRGYAKAAMVTDHFGVYSYGAQFLANTKSDFTPYFNSISNSATADAAEALVQFADKRPCYVDPLSASGFIVPEGLLQQNKIATQPAIFLQSHTAVIRALYIQGICDFGVTFAIYGDPRTSTAILKDLPDIMQKIFVIWQTGEIIPNLNLSFQSKVPEAVVNKMTQAMDEIVLSEEGRQTISNANAYDIQDLKAIDDKYYDPLRKLVISSRVNLKMLIGK